MPCNPVGQANLLIWMIASINATQVQQKKPFYNHKKSSILTSVFQAFKLFVYSPYISRLWSQCPGVTSLLLEGKAEDL